MAGTRSLVIAPQWIGDAVMSEPLMRALADRGERLSVVALPWVAPVYQAMPQVSEVIEAPFRHGGLQWRERFAMAKMLKDRFDCAYVLPNSLKSALLPWLTGIPIRIGRLGESRWGLLNRRLPNPPRDERPPMVEFYLALAGPLPSGTAPATPRMNVDTETAGVALQTHGLRAGDYGVFAPGAEFGPAKRWPAHHYAALARELGQTVVLLGSAKEAKVGQSIADAAIGSPARVLNLTGTTRLPEAFELISRARWLVSNDSGLMHVAAALGVPQVAVFGSSSPLHTPPLNPKARVLWLKNDPQYHPALECAPCFERLCPLGHMRCLNDLGPERVAQALASLAGQARPDQP
ncbi:MAG: lipopolysaccharide heptosyltransferase II [Alphaproteobacteria bacterium]|nr:lipopolysaccharide heptosyltransferase II [Alphaproteobacteria bacterium]